jgi:hypothetical protein
MKRSIHLTATATLFLLFSISTMLLAKSIMPPPSTTELTGSWLGHSGGMVDFFLLELDADGTGYMSVSFLPECPAYLYRVGTWKLKGHKLELQLQPLDPKAEPLWVRNVDLRMPSSMRMEIAGKGWSRQVSLFNETRFMTRRECVKKRLASQRESTPQP